MLGKEKNERAEGRLTFRAQVTQIANSEFENCEKMLKPSSAEKFGLPSEQAIGRIPSIIICKSITVLAY